MISPSTAALAVSLAKGLIKLGQRLDVLLAEKQAVTSDLVLPMPKINAGPSGVQKARELRKYLGEPLTSPDLDPLGDDRADLGRELAGNDPDGELVGLCYRRVYPARLLVPAIDPDGEYLAALKRLLPSMDLSDDDVLQAAFHIAAGRDGRGLNYGARIGLLVADVVSEFGAENTALFVRDAGVRNIVQAVLERFSKPELETFTEWSPLLRHALSATLNGFLDARATLVGDSQWLTVLLDVLAQARDDKAGGDDFLPGLFQGSGYPLLLSLGLSRAAGVLAEDQADTFRQIASDLMKTAAPLAAGSQSFGDFFADHWGDLLRAALGAMEKHGPALLRDQPELLGDVMRSMVKELAQIPQARLLSNETLFRLGDAAIAAVAAKPGLLTTKVGDQSWLRALLTSFVSTIARDGLRLSFSQEGLENIMVGAAGTFAEHPELIVENAGLAREVAGGILRAVSDLPSLDARNLATAAVTGALQALADNPGLMGTRYAKLIGEFAGCLAGLVKARALTGLEASAIASAAAQTLLHNPTLFDQTAGNLATAVLNAVLGAAAADPGKMLMGGVLVDTVREILAAFARHGKVKAGAMPMKELTAILTTTISAALAVTAAEIGHRIDLRGLPAVLAGLIGAWARGDIPEIDPALPAFKQQFEQLLLAA